MKKKMMIVGALIAVLSFGLSNSADAHRWGCRGGYGYRPARVWCAPPIPRVVVAAPAYGYGYGNAYGYGYRGGYGYGRPAPRRCEPRGYGYRYERRGGYGRRW